MCLGRTFQGRARWHALLCMSLEERGNYHQQPNTTPIVTTDNNKYTATGTFVNDTMKKWICVCIFAEAISLFTDAKMPSTNADYITKQHPASHQLFAFHHRFAPQSTIIFNAFKMSSVGKTTSRFPVRVLGTRIPIYATSAEPGQYDEHTI